MKEILNRYNNCLLCGNELTIQYFDGCSLSGSLNKIPTGYLLTYNNKSKIHKVVFDDNFKILENDGYPKHFYLIKYCDQCGGKDLVHPPFFTLNNLSNAGMFYMFYINNRKKENVILLEELFRFKQDGTYYGWHAKFNAKDKVWNTSILVNTGKTKIGELFVKTLESDACNKFNDIDSLKEKLELLYTFS